MAYSHGETCALNMNLYTFCSKLELRAHDVTEYVQEYSGSSAEATRALFFTV